MLMPPTPANGGPNTLGEIFSDRATNHPDAPFLRELGAPESISYCVAARRAEALQAALRSCKITPGDVVGLYLANSPSWVIASFAVWGLGAKVAACGTLVPPQQASELFQRMDARAVVHAVGSGLPERSGIEIQTNGEIEPAHSGDVRDNLALDYHALDPTDTACIFFTSGTTGAPKAIPRSHGALIEGARQVATAYARTSGYRPNPAPPHLPASPIFSPYGHTSGYGQLAFRMWIGRSVLLVPKFTVDALSQVLREQSLDSLHLTPTMVHMLANSEEQLHLSGVKYVTSGTAPLPVATRDAFEARFGVPVTQAYGMTETGPLAQERLADVLAGRRGAGSVGRAAEGMEIRILADSAKFPSAVDGEILVRSARSDRLARLELDGDGWFHTGDVGHLDADGILYIAGRLTERMIVGGFNVYPAEIENAARESDLVRDIAVVALADSRLGEKPVACVVWAGEADAKQLEQEMRQRLPAYKVPRRFLAVSAVPLTPRGKVDRRRCVEIAVADMANTAEHEQD